VIETTRPSQAKSPNRLLGVSALRGDNGIVRHTNRLEAPVVTQFMGRSDNAALVFELLDRKFSVPLNAVDEILPAVNLLSLPGSHKAMSGLLDVRGKIVPVLDLSKVLNIESRDMRYTDHLVVLNLGKDQVAIRVDRATEITAFPETQSQASASRLPFTAAVVAQVVRHDGQLITALSPETFTRLLQDWDGENTSNEARN